MKIRFTNMFLGVAAALLIFFGCGSGIRVRAESFCYPSQELSGDMKAFFSAGANPYGKSSQGMCVAGDSVIYTRYNDDSSPTTYVVLDRDSGKEISHQEFHTLHSNSLTYNPETSEVVTVTKSHAYVFSFIGGKLTLTHDYILSHNCPKIAYSTTDHCYYLGTSTEIFRTSDFTSLTKVFDVSQKAINQGMGCDGDHLFIIWYQVGHNTIAVYDLNGHYDGSYTLNSDSYREVEDVDFIDDSLVINIANSGGNNGLYKVPSKHAYSKWKMTDKANCVKAGEKVRECSRCHRVERKNIPPTGKHQPGDWTIQTHPDCSQDGIRVVKCKVCGQVVRKEMLPRLGHAYSEIFIKQLPTVFEPGIKERICLRCHHQEITLIPAVKPYVKAEAKMSLKKGKTVRLHPKIGRGDQITSYQSGDDKILTVTKNGAISPKKSGDTTITITTAAGARAVVKVHVKMVPFF
ncbi:MAG: hypothetical protein U0K57_00580 [Lachnospiraceae bacterium]|nr:hypothetical protein [Lachnospiraceae bacterium]